MDRLVIGVVVLVLVAITFAVWMYKVIQMSEDETDEGAKEIPINRAKETALDDIRVTNESMSAEKINELFHGKPENIGKALHVVGADDVMEKSLSEGEVMEQRYGSLEPVGEDLKMPPYTDKFLDLVQNFGVGACPRLVRMDEKNYNGILSEFGITEASKGFVIPHEGGNTAVKCDRRVKGMKVVYMKNLKKDAREEVDMLLSLMPEREK